MKLILFSFGTLDYVNPLTDIKKEKYFEYKLYRQYGIDGLKLKKRGRKPIMPRKDKETNKNTENKKSKYTDEEIEYILAENEYLKKLNALIQEKNQKTNIK